MDVFDAGVVHAAGAAGLGVEGAFEDGAEDGGGDLAPVEIVACLGEEELLHVFVELGDLDIFPGEEAAVDVGEVQQDLVQIGIAFFVRSVEDLEKVDQGAAEILRGKGSEIIMELVLDGEDPGVLGIEAEDEPDAEDVQAFQREFSLLVDIMLEDPVVKLADDVAGLQGKFHFPFDVVLCCIGQEGQTVVIAGEVLEQDLLGLAGGFFHVIDEERGEIAGDDPAGTVGIGQFGGIAFCLLERSQERAIGLFDGSPQVFAQSLLFDQNMGGGDDTVDETGMIQMDLILEMDEIFRFGDPEDTAEQCHPERLAFPFFVAAALPVFGKFFCRLFLFGQIHFFLRRFFCSFAVIYCGTFPLSIAVSRKTRIAVGEKPAKK